MAWTIKELSCDGQTKHGCVITDYDNKPLGWGYNSFPRECQNHLLPNLRPDKYPWMIHSEVNAVSNCVKKPLGCGGIAYVTGICCFNCVCHLWQNGVTKIYQINRNSSMLEYSEDEELKAKLLEHVGKNGMMKTYKTPLEIITVEPDFTFSLDIQSQANKLDLIHDERTRSGRCFEDVG